VLTLDSKVIIPTFVSFSSIKENTFLLNTSTNTYFRLDAVGTRFWELITEGNSLRNVSRILEEEFEVEESQLEQDLFELITKMLENGLVQLI